jgi:hypothetical protein
MDVLVQNELPECVNLLVQNEPPEYMDLLVHIPPSLLKLETACHET